MPVIWITISLTTGVIFADSLSWDIRSWVWFALGSCLTVAAALYFLRKKTPAISSWMGGLILGVTIAFSLGGIRFLAALPDFQNPAFITNCINQKYSLVLSGVVIDFPDDRDQITNLLVRVESIHGSQDEEIQPANGLILAKIPVENQIAYGDYVRLTGNLTLPPEDEDFNYREYLKRQNIYAYMSRAEVEVLASNQGNALFRIIFALKTRALEILYQLWPDPEASLLAGILLGVESGISDHVQKAFRETGTTHVIAISGFNITIVAGFFSRFFSRFLNPRKGALAAMLGIGFYTLLVGADAAVVRAAVMGGLSIFAQQIGRRQHGLNAAALASFVMIIINPQLPWDISFQLSLSATLGLILYADPLAGWFLRLSSRFLPLEKAQKITQPVSEYVLFTFAAQLTTLPVMIYHFRAFSLKTFLANPAILPVQPPIMVIGGLALILALVWFPLGRIAAPLVYPFVLYTIRVVELFSRLPIRTNQIGEVGVGSIALFYIVLLLFTFGSPLMIRIRSILTPTLAAGGLALGVVLVWRLYFSAPDGNLNFYLLDVGAGSGIYLESPSGQRILINGGTSTKLLSDHLGRKLPPFQRDLDVVLITSPLEQDLDALADNLLRFVPATVVWLGDPFLCWEAENLHAQLEQNQIPLIFGEIGQTLVLSDGVRIKIVAESPRGGTVLIEYLDFRALLPFGITAEAREGLRMGKDLGELTVLYLADNGYQSSNPSAWINNLHPRLVLLSVGIKDSRGLPDRGLLDRLGGYSLLRTDQHGTIHLSTDGKQFWVKVERFD